MARGLLCESGGDQEEINAIVHAVEAHSRYGGPDPHTLEARILQDADAVEYVGAIGLARGIVRAVESGEYRGDVRQLPALVNRLMRQVQDSQHTRKGQVLVEGRIAWLREFQARLEAELAGEL